MNKVVGEIKRVARLIPQVNPFILNNKVVLNKNLHIAGFGDVKPAEGSLLLAETVFVENCDKNFVFNWMNKHYFPQLRTLFLASHPCEPMVLNQDYNIYLLDRFRRYGERWGNPHHPIATITKDEFNSLLSNYQPEELRVVDR